MSNNVPFFSVLIPIYNTALFLSRCLDSVLNQTFKDIEIICVNDFSTDNSLEILNNYSVQYENLKIISHVENRGTYEARYTGVFASKGKYILFLDSDDTLVPDACQILYSNLKLSRYDVLEFAYKRIPDGTIWKPSTEVPQDRVLAMLGIEKGIPWMLWNKVYDSEMLKRAYSAMNHFYCILVEDIYQSLIIGYFTKKVKVIDVPLYIYSDGVGDSTKKTKSMDSVLKYLLSIKNLFINIDIFFDSHEQVYANCSFILKRNIFHQIIGNYIYLWTEKKERGHFLLLLLNYFPAEITEPYFSKIFENSNSFESINRGFSLKRIYKFIKFLIKKDK